MINYKEDKNKNNYFNQSIKKIIPSQYYIKSIQDQQQNYQFYKKNQELIIKSSSKNQKIQKKYQSHFITKSNNQNIQIIFLRLMMKIISNKKNWYFLTYSNLQIALLYTQLEDSEKKAQNLVKDNQFLLNQMQNKCKQILQIYQKGFPEDNLIETYNKLQRQTQIDLMESMREQNQYLTQYSQELEQKYLKLQLQFDQARNTTEKYFQTYKNQSDELKEAFIKVDDLLKVKQVLEKKFDEISHENIQLESNKQLLESKLTKIQQELKNSKNQYFSLKKSSREDVDKVQSELDSLKIEYENVSKRERQSFNRIMIFERETESLKDGNRNLKRQVQKTKGDFENTIKMLQAYETKINNSEKKMQAMKEFVDENKQNLDRVILEKDKAQLKIQQLEKQNQNLRNKHLDEVSNLKNSFEKIINNLNEKLRLVEESKEDIISEMHQRQVSIKNQNQKLKRFNNDLRVQNSNLLYSMKSNSGSEILIKIRQLEEKNENLTRIINQYDRKILQEKELKDQIIQNLQQQVRQINHQLQKERNASANSLRQLTQLKSKLSIINNQKDCVQNQLTRFKRLFDQKNMNNIQQKDWKVKDLQQKLQEAIQRQKNIRREAIQKLEKYDQTQRQLQMQYKNIINALERQIQDLKRKLKKKKEKQAN